LGSCSPLGVHVFVLNRGAEVDTGVSARRAAAASIELHYGPLASAFVLKRRRSMRPPSSVAEMLSHIGWSQ
jgi:hypothetical protein